MGELQTDNSGGARPREDGLIAWAHVIYGLHGLSVLTGMLTSVTVVVGRPGGTDRDPPVR